MGRSTGDVLGRLLPLRWDKNKAVIVTIAAARELRELGFVVRSGNCSCCGQPATFVGYPGKDEPDWFLP